MKASQVQIRTGRQAAVQVLFNTLEEGAYANIALNSVLERSQLSPKERGLATELVYGTLKNMAYLDWVLNQFLSKPLEKLDPYVKGILRMSAYQLLKLDKIPSSAAVNEGVNLTKLYSNQGAAKLVNAVLRNVIRRQSELKVPSLEEAPAQYLSIMYSHPQWLVERWIEELGIEETEELCKANNQTPPLTIRVNTLRNTSEQLIEALKQRGIEAEASELSPTAIRLYKIFSLGNIEEFREGLFTAQDESSQLIAPIVAPTPGTFGIDACSAPGGKATHLAQLMNNSGKVLAIDLYPHKIKLLEESASRLGIDIIETKVWDGRKLASKWEKQADFVLVDAPCSGLGVLRRRPDMRWRKEIEQISELQEIQSRILQSAGACVKKGGTLVYSTCTVTREENLEQVENFTKNNPDFQLVSLKPYLPESLQEETAVEKGYLQLWPHRHGTDGFFVARWERK